MALNLEQRTTQLGNFVAREMGARTCQVLEVRRLTGGTVHENWYVELDLTEGAEGLVLKPAQQRPSLVNRNGLLVHRGKLPRACDWNRLIEDVRDERMRRLAGL